MLQPRCNGQTKIQMNGPKWKVSISVSKEFRDENIGWFITKDRCSNVTHNNCIFGKTLKFEKKP